MRNGDPSGGGGDESDSTIRMAILFALPQEYGTFMRLAGPWRMRSRRPFRSFSRCFPAIRQKASLSSKGGQGGAEIVEVILLETGMGRKQMLEGLEWLFGWFHPDLVVASGFAGSLAREVTVGGVCLGEMVASFDGPPGARVEDRFNSKIWECFAPFWSKHRVARTRVVTVPQPQPKQPLSRVFSEPPAILDMETWFAAQFCHERRLPFIALRAVSDGLGDEIDFDPAAISDARGHVSIPLVLVSVLRNPRLLASYYSAWRRSRLAAANLGKVLRSLLELPPAELRKLVSAGAEW